MFSSEELDRLKNACQSKQKRIKSQLKNIAPKYRETTDTNMKLKWEYRKEQKN